MIFGNRVRKPFVLLSLFWVTSFWSLTVFGGGQDPVDLKAYSGLTFSDFKKLAYDEFDQTDELSYNTFQFQEIFRAFFVSEGTSAETESWVRDYARIASFLEQPREVYVCLKYINEKLKEAIRERLPERGKQELLSLIELFRGTELTAKDFPPVSPGLRQFETARFRKLLTLVLSEIEFESRVRLVEPHQQKKKVWFSNDGDLFDGTVQQGRFIKDVGAGREHGFYTHQIQWDCVYLGKKLDLNDVNSLENSVETLFKNSVNSNLTVSLTTETFLARNPKYRVAGGQLPKIWMKLRPYEFVSDASVVQQDLSGGSSIPMDFPIWVQLARSQTGQLVSTVAEFEALIRNSLGLFQNEFILDPDFTFKELFVGLSPRNPFWLTRFIFRHRHNLDALALKQATYWTKPQFQGWDTHEIIGIYRLKYNTSRTAVSVDRAVESTLFLEKALQD